MPFTIKFKDRSMTSKFALRQHTDRPGQQVNVVDMAYDPSVKKISFVTKALSPLKKVSTKVAGKFSGKEKSRELVGNTDASPESAVTTTIDLSGITTIDQATKSLPSNKCTALILAPRSEAGMLKPIMSKMIESSAKDQSRIRRLLCLVSNLRESKSREEQKHAATASALQQEKVRSATLVDLSKEFNEIIDAFKKETVDSQIRFHDLSAENERLKSQAGEYSDAADFWRKKFEEEQNSSQDFIQQQNETITKQKGTIFAQKEVIGELTALIHNAGVEYTTSTPIDTTPAPESAVPAPYPAEMSLGEWIETNHAPPQPSKIDDNEDPDMYGPPPEPSETNTNESSQHLQVAEHEADETNSHESSEQPPAPIADNITTTDEPSAAASTGIEDAGVTERPKSNGSSPPTDEDEIFDVVDSAAPATADTTVPSTPSAESGIINPASESPFRGFFEEVDKISASINESTSKKRKAEGDEGRSAEDQISDKIGSTSSAETTESHSDSDESVVFITEVQDGEAAPLTDSTNGVSTASETLFKNTHGNDWFAVLSKGALNSKLAYNSSSMINAGAQSSETPSFGDLAPKDASFTFNFAAPSNVDPNASQPEEDMVTDTPAPFLIPATLGNHDIEMPDVPYQSEETAQERGSSDDATDESQLTDSSNATTQLADDEKVEEPVEEPVEERKAKTVKRIAVAAQKVGGVRMKARKRR